MAKKPVTIEEVLHPLGKGAGAISMRYLENDLMTRFHKIILPNIPAIKVVKKGEDYVLLVRIPSERNERAVKPVFYDVVFEFYPKNKEDRTSLYVVEYGVRIYSNSPSYVFTFTYVYEERGMLPSFIPKKYYNPESLKSAPKVRNPIELLGVEKSIWYAIHYLEKNQLLQKSRLDSLANSLKANIKSLMDEVKTQTEKLEERINQRLKRKIKTKSGSSGSSMKGTIDNDDTVLTSPQNLAQLKTTSLTTTNLKSSPLGTKVEMKSGMKHSSPNAMKTSSLKTTSKKAFSVNALGKKPEKK